jgi:hypothetical protein
MLEIAAIVVVTTTTTAAAVVCYYHFYHYYYHHHDDIKIFRRFTSTDDCFLLQSDKLCAKLVY